MKTKAISLSLIIGLSACGGSSGGGMIGPNPVLKQPNPAPEAAPEPTVLAAGRVSSSNDPTLRGRVSEDAETITVRIDGTKHILNVVDTNTKPLRFGFHGGNNTEVIAGIAENNATRAGFVITSVQGDPDSTEMRTFVEQLGDTTLPMSGKAEFSGDYTGMLGGTFFVEGDAEMTANFNQGTIRGAITNRQLSDGQNGIEGIDAGDLRLEKTSIDGNGAFTGTTSQGDMVTEGGTIFSQGGSYLGMITGNKGGQLGGAVTNDFEMGETTLREVGVFLPSNTTWTVRSAPVQIQKRRQQ